MKINKNNLYLFITIFILTFSHCVAYVGTTKESLLENLGYVLLLGGILYSYYRSSLSYRIKNTFIMVVILVILMVPGIMLQNLPVKRKVTIIFTVLAIIIVSVMSEKFLSDFRKFRVMAYACLFGVIFSTLISVVHGVPVVRNTSEPMFGMIYYFNGGIRDKNVATMMIAIFMSLYIYSREMKKTRDIDRFVMIVSLAVLFLANSRGAWIEFAVFLIVLNLKQIGRIIKAHRGIVVLVLVLILIPVIIYLYNEYIMKSATYLYRYRGLTNYLAMFREDKFHMIFGNAELAYGSGLDYATAVRSVTGWNGTIENAWLNILIKSGVLGIIAYVILFARAIVTACRCRILWYKTIYLAITATLLVSSFVAIYIQTIHGLFGIYCYLLMAYYSGLIRENNYFKRPAAKKVIRKYPDTIFASAAGKEPML